MREFRRSQFGDIISAPFSRRRLGGALIKITFHFQPQSPAPDVRRAAPPRPGPPAWRLPPRPQASCTAGGHHPVVFCRIYSPYQDSLWHNEENDRP